MDLVTIYHPGLDRETEVPAASVQHWRIAGWQEGPRPAPAEEPGEPKQGDQEPADQAKAPDPTPPTSRPRRATARTEE